MFKKIAIVQSNYIPWKGYFDLINLVDEFVLYDDSQYTRRDWRNRNRIKAHGKLSWLTIPVEVKGKYYQKIKDTRISDKTWNKKHWATILHSYRKAKFFNEYRDFFEELYLSTDEDYLSLLNYRFITSINELLGITTKITWSSDYNQVNGKTEKLVNICKETGANEYWSGPAAKEYIDPASFEEEKIKLCWMNYDNYPEYEQPDPPFEHNVSIID